MHQVTDGDAVESDDATPGLADRIESEQFQRVLVAVVALGAAVGAAFADSAPTGLDWWDTILRAGVAALFVVAAWRAPDWLMVLAAAAAAGVVSDSDWFGPALLALVLAIGTGALPRRQPSLKIIAAGVTIQVLMRIPALGFFGLPSLIAGTVVIVTLVLGYFGAASTTRRIARWATGVTVVAVIVAGAVGGFVLLGAKSDVDRGIAAARAGLSAARGGDPEEVVARLETASDALSSAESQTTGILTRPLQLLPVIAQHRRAVTVATRQGSDIARQASRTTTEADISSVSMSAGSVDLAALSAMEADLATTVELLENGVIELDSVQSPWLVGPVATRLDELTDELRDVLPEARVAADAARVLPGMLGQDGPRRYFVAFGSPAEARELGGFVGSWAVLELEAGSIRQAEAGRISDLYDLARSQDPLGFDDYPRWFVERARPGTWPQNITGSPSLSTVAEASRHLFDGVGGGEIDGFVYLDASAFAAILQLTGPVRIEGVDQPINAGNAVDFLLDEQYRLENRQTLKSELGELFGEAFDDLLDSELPGPERLGQILGPSARQGRLQVMTFDDAENAFLQSVKLQRPFAWPAQIPATDAFGADAFAADAFAVVQTNGLQNKLDLYADRQVSYDVSIDDDGELVGTVTVELTFDVPADAPEVVLGERDGESLTYLSLFTPHGVTEIRLDGEVVEPAFTVEFGYTRSEVTVELAANQTRTIEYDLVGSVDPSLDYNVSVWYQPLVNNDTVDLSYTHDGRTETVDAFELVETTVVSFTDE